MRIDWGRINASREASPLRGQDDTSGLSWLSRRASGRSVEERCRPLRGSGLSRRFDEPVVGREMTGGIGGRGIPCEMKGLAAAAAEIDLAPLAAPARLGHPALAAERVEARRVEPDLAERPVLHRVEPE